MRRIRSFAAAAAVMAWALASPAATAGPDPAWVKLQTLVGEWKGRYEGADSADGEVRLSCKLVSNGTSLMETMESGHDKSMVTVYHRDGARILATHYCAAGNQPRLTAPGLSAGGQTLVFSFVDASNVAGPEAEVMRGLVVTFQDPDHFSQAWTSRAGGGKDQIGTFVYTRVK